MGVGMQRYSVNTFQKAKEDDEAARRDLELVAAARRGSHAAFEEIQNRYSRRLYHRIRSMTGNHEDAEDALQETFLRAYLALNAFEGRSQFGSWLTRIAINSALMVLRRRRVRSEVSLELQSTTSEAAASIDVPDAALDPEQVCDLRQTSDCVLHAMSKLNKTLRPAITTWIEQECSIKELAHTLGLPVPTVKARLHRARKKLSSAPRLKNRVPNVGAGLFFNGRYST
jgi:RNA polymerase sigma-70 factor, ECF subfamily